MVLFLIDDGVLEFQIRLLRYVRRQPDGFDWSMFMHKPDLDGIAACLTEARPGARRPHIVHMPTSLFDAYAKMQHLLPRALDGQTDPTAQALRDDLFVMAARLRWHTAVIARL